MGIADLEHRRISVVAFCGAVITTVLEVAVIGHIYGVGNVTADIIKRIYLLIDSRLTLHKTDGIGVNGYKLYRKISEYTFYLRENS